MRGRVFEIREFCLHDGPGPRTTVFLQGCPLRCTWCQNPEGQAASGGREMTADDLVAEIFRTADFLKVSNGGITFSGGEPLAQANFVCEVCDQLKAAGLHLAIETSGFADEALYRRVVDRMDFVLQDVKFADLEGYRRWTGVDAGSIFRNLAWLKASGKPFVVRVPLIPGVNDSAGTKAAIAERLAGSAGLQRVELLPYNRLAGAKYAKLGRTYAPGFDETAVPDGSVEPFVAADLACACL